MMHKERIWDIKEYNSQMADYLAEELNISPMVTGILLERGLQDAASMRDFLYGSATPFHDPFLLKDMQRSVERIERALAAGEQITVYGDYDVDGISASSLLYLYLKQRGGRVATGVYQVGSFHHPRYRLRSGQAADRRKYCFLCTSKRHENHCRGSGNSS